MSQFMNEFVFYKKQNKNRVFGSDCWLPVLTMTFVDTCCLDNEFNDSHLQHGIKTLLTCRDFEGLNEIMHTRLLNSVPDL